VLGVGGEKYPPPPPPSPEFERIDLEHFGIEMPGISYIVCPTYYLGTGAT
jgi:hypothetical protein